MKYFSTFAGMGAFEEAVRRLGLDWECIGYSEIDKYAIAVHEKNFPGYKNYGDITKIDIQNMPDFDFLVGGSPCQDLSSANTNRQGLTGIRSGLFYKFLEILKVKKPKYFILENVESMDDANRDIISNLMGVSPVMINASSFSAQNRKRLFWCNWKVELPTLNNNLTVKDILEKNIKDDSEYLLSDEYYDKVQLKDSRKKSPMEVQCMGGIKSNGKKIYQGHRVFSLNGKSPTLCAIGGGLCRNSGLFYFGDYIRRLTSIECERLQGFPDDYSRYGIMNNKVVEMSTAKRQKMIGNAFNVDVIVHILKQFEPSYGQVLEQLELNLK